MHIHNMIYNMLRYTVIRFIKFSIPIEHQLRKMILSKFFSLKLQNSTIYNINCEKFFKSSVSNNTLPNMILKRQDLIK